MTYTIIVMREGKEDLVFKGIPDYFAEPGSIRIEVQRGRWSSVWRTVDEVTGLILHEEEDGE